jgi:Peptidase family M1 domain/Peptidase M1 N-terminal domain
MDFAPRLATAVVTAVLASITIAACGGSSSAGLGSAPTFESGKTAGARCAAGARTLSARGDVLYPEVGNGGYTSVHTATHTVYDAATNRFLAGNHVDLTNRATQCLSNLSLDFERFEPGGPKGSPDMQVQSVSIDGTPASFRFAQPTYPSDPKGPDDPDPRAHEASQHDPVGGPDHNPLPPACSPELTEQPKLAVPDYKLHKLVSSDEESQDGSQCPADKLVITPQAPIPDGHLFTITVNYTGTPGVHYDGDGSAEGWFRTADGNWMATEPVGSEDWMPLNDYPSAKPTYDFSITTERGKTAIANGQRVSVTDGPPDAAFPQGSTTTRWHAPMPIASYLALTIVGDYTVKVHTVAGTRYYQFQDRHIPARLRAKNAAVIASQPGVTRFQARFTGPYPFASDGIVAGSPQTRSSEEEMESMIVLPGQGLGLVDVGGLVHENFHQWWGDNVSDANFDMTFFKEGMATLAVQLDLARQAAQKSGGPDTTAGRAAFEHYLVHQFNSLYASGPGAWQLAPANRSPATYLDLYAVYQRPKAALIALRQILGPRRFDAVLHWIQRRDAGSSVTEAQLEAAFATRLPNRNAVCQTRLSQFFRQWFDTAYHGSKPQITGPGLHGQPFYAHGCAPPGRR